MSFIYTNTLIITDGQNNSINYAGNLDNDVFSNNSIINSFTNSAIVLGGGGSAGQNGSNGKNSLINYSTITTLRNTGIFLGGGGGGAGRDSGSIYYNAGTGGAGGGGGGGGDSSGNGGIYGGGGGGGGGESAGGRGGSNPGGGGGGANDGNDGEDGPNGIGGNVNGSNGGNIFGGNGGNSVNGNLSNGGGGYGNDANTLYDIGGGGGGGGGKGSGIIGTIGGNGGYGIYNFGTITTLINSQGGTSINTTNNITNYGPLFYAGAAPTNYNILINSTTQYGQLWCTGVTDTIGSITFDIADGSTLTTGTYSSVLKFNSGTVTLNNTSGTYNNYNWMLIQNGLYYDLVLTSSSLPCFMEGSKILTNKGYQLIENLRNGDLIKTLKNGYLPIVMIGKSEIYNSCNEERIKNRLYNLSCKNYPKLTEDLVLTGCHSILVDNITSFQELEMSGEEKRLYITDDKLRLFCYLDPLSDPYDKEGIFTIYHIALENENYYGNYGIYANGLLVETCSIRYLKELSNMILIE